MTALDVLSAIGQLSMSGENSFDEAALLCHDGSDAGFHPSAMRRSLEGLGHIRCNFDARRVKVIAARFCILPSEGAGDPKVVLVGARSEALLEELFHLAVARNVENTREPLKGGLPDRVSFRGSFDKLSDVARNANCAQISISSDPSIPDAWRLLSHVPYLRDILEGICSQLIGYSVGCPQTTDSIYNPENGFYASWMSLRESYGSSYLLWKKTPYDYRLATRTETGNWRLYLEPLAIDPFLGWWAARMGTGNANSLPEISGDGKFKVPRACPLPSSLHQVCCLCSGTPPEQSDQFFVYLDVPPVIQHGINERLAVN